MEQETLETPSKLFSNLGFDIDAPTTFVSQLN